MYKKIIAASFALVLSVFFTTGAGAQGTIAGYVKMDEKLYVGAYCRIATGATQTVLASLISAGLTAGGVPIPPGLVSEVLKTVTLKKDDAYCLWVNLNRYPVNDFNPMVFKLRHMGLVRADAHAKKSSFFYVNLYDDKGKKIPINQNESGLCDDWSCWTGVIPATAGRKSAGVTACIQTTNANGKWVSMVFKTGVLPGLKETPAEVKDQQLLVKEQHCDNRKEDWVLPE